MSLYLDSGLCTKSGMQKKDHYSLREGSQRKCPRVAESEHLDLFFHAKSLMVELSFALEFGAYSLTYFWVILTKGLKQYIRARWSRRPFALI